MATTLIVGALLLPALNAQSYSYSQPSLSLPVGTADVILSTLASSTGQPAATGLAENFAKIVSGGVKQGSSSGSNGAVTALDVGEGKEDGRPNVDLGTTSASEDLFGPGSGGLAGYVDTDDGGNGPIFADSSSEGEDDEDEHEENPQRSNSEADSDANGESMMEMMEMDMMTKNRRRIARRAPFDESEVPASGGFKNFHWPSMRKNPAFRQFDDNENGPDDNPSVGGGSDGSSGGNTPRPGTPRGGSADDVTSGGSSLGGGSDDSTGPGSSGPGSSGPGSSVPISGGSGSTMKSPKGAKGPKSPKSPSGPPPWDKSYPYEETTDHPYDSPYDQNTDYPDYDSDSLPDWLWQAKRAKEAKGKKSSSKVVPVGTEVPYPYPSPTGHHYTTSSTKKYPSKSYKPSYTKTKSSTKVKPSYTKKKTSSYSPVPTSGDEDYTSIIGFSPVPTSDDSSKPSKSVEPSKTSKSSSKSSTATTKTTPAPTTKKTPTPKTKYTPGRYTPTTLSKSASPAPPSGPPPFTAGPSPGKDWTGDELSQVCPQSCDPTAGKNKCDASTSCTVVTTGKTYCTCRAGFRADGRNEKDFSSQFKWQGQPFVLVAPGITCNTPCQDNTCSEVPERPPCK